MPLSEAQALVRFLREIQGPTESVRGNVDKGREIFFGNGQCSRCHMFAGVGGRLGPDLSRSARGRKPSEIRRSITDPSASIAENFGSYEIELANGQVLRGVSRNMDSFSIQLMDVQERIHLLLTKNVKRSTRLESSVMPASHLSASEVEDLVAFLTTPSS